MDTFVLFARCRTARRAGVKIRGPYLPPCLDGRFNDEPERASRPFDAERDGFVLAGREALPQAPGPLVACTH